MTPRLTTLPLAFAALTACAADPDPAQSTGETSRDTDATTTMTSTTRPTSTGEVTTADVITADVTTSDMTSGGAQSSTTDTGTTDATSTGDADTGDSSTGANGVLGPAALDAMQALEAVVAGVTYPSESDYPWVVVGFADAAPVTEANVKAVIAAVYVPHEGEAGLADRTIELRTVDQLFDPLTVPKDCWEDEHKQVAAQYSEIRAVLADKLVDVHVFRLGQLQGNVLQGAVDVYVLGATADGDVVGMWTVSVET